MQKYKEELIMFLVRAGALKFGEFTTRGVKDDFDVLFGPAYKGCAYPPPARSTGNTI